MRRMFFGGKIYFQSMVVPMEVGPLERLLGLTGSAYGNISKKIGRTLLVICTSKWGMVRRPSSGPTLGVGHAASRMPILSDFV